MNREYIFRYLLLIGGSAWFMEHIFRYWLTNHWLSDELQRIAENRCHIFDFIRDTDRLAEKMLPNI